MKRIILTILLLGVVIIGLTGCGSNTENVESINNIVNYEEKITFPEKGGTYEDYSYGTLYSKTTVLDYSYEISEQSTTQIRIDFDFTCRADYFYNEDAEAQFFNFYIVAKSKDGETVADEIVNITDYKVGDTMSEEFTFLLDKEDVVNGIDIEFTSNE